ERARVEFQGSRKRRRLCVIGEDGAPLPHGFSSYGALVRAEPHPDKALRHLSIRLLSDQLVCEVAAPEIDSRHLKELARRLAEQLDEGEGIRPFSGFGGNAQQQLLKSLIGPRDEFVFRRNDGTTGRNAERRADHGGIGLLIHKCLNLLGKYLSSQFESSEMGRGGAGV